jgi:hypothetical protein
LVVVKFILSFSRKDNRAGEEEAVIAEDRA